MLEQWGIGAISIVIAIAGSVWSMAWWLSGNFNALRKDFMALGKEIIEKLEYHEKHDDVRFNNINNEIWEMKLRNAALKGIVIQNKPATALAQKLKQQFESEDNE